MTECDHRWEDRDTGDVEIDGIHCSRCGDFYLDALPMDVDRDDELVRLSTTLRVEQEMRRKAEADYLALVAENNETAVALRASEEARKAAEDQRDEALAAMSADTADVILHHAVRESEAEARGAARQREADLRWLGARTRDASPVTRAGAGRLGEWLAAQPLVTAQPEEGE